jgi:hypothetical protein
VTLVFVYLRGVTVVLVHLRGMAVVFIFVIEKTYAILMDIRILCGYSCTFGSRRVTCVHSDIVALLDIQI